MKYYSIVKPTAIERASLGVLLRQLFYDWDIEVKSFMKGIAGSCGTVIPCSVSMHFRRHIPRKTWMHVTCHECIAVQATYNLHNVTNVEWCYKRYITLGYKRYILSQTLNDVLYSTTYRNKRWMMFYTAWVLPPVWSNWAFHNDHNRVWLHSMGQV